MSTGGALDVGRVARWLAAIAIAFALGALWMASPATAGTYDVWSCRGPDGTATGTDAWEWAVKDSGGSVLSVLEPPANVQFGDDCATGGGRSVGLVTGSLLELGQPTQGLLRFQVPPETGIAAYALWGVAQSGTPPLVATYSYRADVAGTPCPSPGCVLGSSEIGELPSLVAMDGSGTEELELSVAVECAICLGLAPSGTPPRIDLYRSRVTLEDLVPPDPPRISGTLTEGMATSLTVAAADRGGGVEALSLDIDGQPWKTVRIGATDASCRMPYAVPAPCPEDVGHTFEIDTGTLAPGDHQASGTVVDAAGNSTAWGPVPFRVERPTTTIVTPPRGRPGPSNGKPAVERPRLRLAREVIDAGAGREVRLRGRLATLGGAPISGARLEVSTRQLGLRGTVPNRQRAAVVTDARGRFTVEQRALGARRVTVGFSPRPGAAPTARAVATIRSRLSLSTAPSASQIVKGRRLTLRGRLLGAGPSARGALVQIQAVVNGRWAPVGRARAGRSGGYAWRYRFVHLTRDTVFRFRAVVEHVPGWPWPTVRGAPTAVRVDVP